jgi:hypothetical protein
VARLPELNSADEEAAWLARIEAEFERNAKDPMAENYPANPFRLAAGAQPAAPSPKRGRAEGEE